MKILYKNAAFTLVELIVVITILAILGTIAFISVQDYSKNSRDGVRVADIHNMRNGLDLFGVARTQLPIPDNATSITFSGATAWYQGVFGDNNVRNIKQLSNKQVDPLTGSEYTYSLTGYGTEYEIAAILESLNTNLSYIPGITTTHAASSEAIRGYVSGNYNGKFLKTSTGGVDYILAVPSIITSDILDSTVETITSNKMFVLNRYFNLPNSYNGSGIDLFGGFDFEADPLVVFSGSVNDLSGSGSQKIFLHNLQTAYTGSVLSMSNTHIDMMNVDINNTNQVNNYVSILTSSTIGGLPDLEIKYNNN